MSLRVIWIATHPIQYQVPVFRELAVSPEVNFSVAFLTQHGMKPSFDTQFQRVLQWDIPLLEGYDWELVGGAPSSLEKVRLREVVQYVFSLRADLLVVPGYASPALAAVLVAAHLRGIRCAVLSDSTLESTRLVGAKRRIKTALLRRLLTGHHALVPGVRARRAILALGIPGRRIHMYPHCVDMDRLDTAFAQRATLRAAKRAELGWGPDDVGFLFVGKLYPLKQPLEIVDAFSHAGGGRLAMVGAGELEQQVQARCALVPGAQFLGFYNQAALPGLYAAADVLVLYSKSETWGLVVNEAMAMGTPVIVSKAVGCVDDLVAEKNTGWTVDENDVVSLSLAMRAAMASRAQLTEMGINARRVIAAYRPRDAVRGVVSAAVAASHE